VHTFGSFPGVDAIDPGLVLVPLRDRDEEIGQRAVHAVHQRVGRQTGPNHQLAGAVKQPSGVVIFCFLRRSVPPGRHAGHAHQIRATGGEGIATGARNASQAGLKLRVLDGGPRTVLGAFRHELALLFGREGLEGFVDAQRGRERQTCLAPVKVSSHVIRPFRQ
jgi:hypothetical protein